MVSTELVNGKKGQEIQANKLSFALSLIIDIQSKTENGNQNELALMLWSFLRVSFLGLCCMKLIEHIVNNNEPEIYLPLSLIKCLHNSNNN